MKQLIIFLVIFFIQSFQLKGDEKMIDNITKDKVKQSLIRKYGESIKFRVEKGVDQVAEFWIKEDGSVADFELFCEKYFIGTPELLEENFKKLETNLEVLYGNFNKMILDLKRSLDLDLGEIRPIDMLFGEYNPSSHLSDDFFKNKIAFCVLLNFPYYSLKEKIELSPKWNRKDWAYARMGDIFTSRVPAEIYQKISEIMTKADTYISEYNIYMGKLIDKKNNTLFPEDMKLITHWGLRDELKANYNARNGLEKQRMIYQVMQRIINQEIPTIVINKKDYQWNPFDNMVVKDGKSVPFEKEPNTRYQILLSVHKVLKGLDPFYPNVPSHIKRKFEVDREIPEIEIEKLFTDFISSEQIKKVGKLISKRLGRKLEPFDIWYDGFKPRSAIQQEELDKIVSQKYPDIKAFQNDIKNILIKLGFSPEKAEFVAGKIDVDPARGSGHAAGAQMKSDKAHLRTRVPKGGMNYKGFNIAIHELGHCVEQTFTLQNVDYYILNGVPNTAFTEAFAFVFQGRDLDILGIKNENPEKKYLEAIDNLWAAYEIMGVSLVDMKIWNWMYNNPNTTAEELKKAVISIANEIWNKYYADIFGVKDQSILAIYSHMIDAALYLPDYPLGHVIDFQIEKYLEGKNLGDEMERMCITGKIIPQEWMKNAVGSEISTKPLLDAAEEALKFVK
jgi:hypothetical protein